ncbi:MAG: hypothetical protein WEB19_04185 [Acidimicrobiia bacterium]
MTPEPDLEPKLEPGLSRRAFLAGGLATAGGLVVAASWGSAAAAADATGLQPRQLSSDLYASPDPQRFVIALARGGPKGIEDASGPKLKVRFKPPPASASTPWGHFLHAPLDRAGLPKGRGVYVSNPVLDRAGIWKVQFVAAGERVPFAIQVNARPIAPVAGQAAPRAASPTTTDTLGVSPICTRRPACPLHTVSLSSVIGAGKPVAALFATPARCSSQYCGPVLDEMLKIMDPYKDRVTFVHTEIYQSLTGTALVPTVSAWGLETEPWLFGIDAAGTIRARLDGAFGGTEMKKLLDGLVSPQ